MKIAAVVVIATALAASSASAGAPPDNTASVQSQLGMPARVRRLDVTTQLGIDIVSPTPGECKYSADCKGVPLTGTISIHAVASGEDFVLSELSLTINGESVAKAEIAQFIGRTQAFLDHLIAVQPLGYRSNVPGESNPRFGPPYVALRGLIVKSDTCDPEDAEIVILYNLLSKTSKASETCFNGFSGVSQIKVLQ